MTDELRRRGVPRGHLQLDTPWKPRVKERRDRRDAEDERRECDDPPERTPRELFLGEEGSDAKTAAPRHPPMTADQVENLPGGHPTPMRDSREEQVGERENAEPQRKQQVARAPAHEKAPESQVGSQKVTTAATHSQGDAEVGIVVREADVWSRAMNAVKMANPTVVTARRTVGRRPTAADPSPARHGGPGVAGGSYPRRQHPSSRGEVFKTSPEKGRSKRDEMPVSGPSSLTRRASGAGWL